MVDQASRPEIYLDYAATAPVHPAAALAVQFPGVRAVASDAVIDRCPPELRELARPLGPQRVRGRQDPVACFDVTPRRG